jgi:hypothetical protein
MKYRLSFADLNILNEDIIEVVVDAGIEMSLEMMDEYDSFLSNHFDCNFGLLINRVHQYSYSYEVQLSIASHKNLKAIGVVNYSEQSKKSTGKIKKLRAIDGWNLAEFSGLEMGWQKGLAWLQHELKGLKIHPN